MRRRPSMVRPCRRRSLLARFSQIYVVTERQCPPDGAGGRTSDPVGPDHDRPAAPPRLRTAGRPGSWSGSSPRGLAACAAVRTSASFRRPSCFFFRSSSWSSSSRSARLVGASADRSAFASARPVPCASRAASSSAFFVCVCLLACGSAGRRSLASSSPQGSRASVCSLFRLQRSFNCSSCSGVIACSSASRGRFRKRSFCALQILRLFVRSTAGLARPSGPFRGRSSSFLAS